MASSIAELIVQLKVLRKLMGSKKCDDSRLITHRGTQDALIKSLLVINHNNSTR